MRFGLRDALLLILGLGALGCAREKPTAAWAGTVDTLPGGAVLVKNPEQGIWDSTNGWRIVEVARIGSADGTGPASFSQIGSVAVDPAGRIYVLDLQAQDVRVFDSTGTWIRTLGRRGGGPGEFAQASGLVWDTAGRLWVVDQQNATYSVFDTAGQLVQSRRRTSTTSAVFPWPGIITSDNRLIEWKGAGLDAAPQLVELDASTLTVRDSFPLPAFSPALFELRRKSGDNLSITRTEVPFAPQLVWRLDADGTLWFGISDQYRIYQRRLSGDTVRVIEKAFTPRPVTSADKDSMLRGMGWFTGQGGQLDESRIPHQQPAFLGFMLDEVGDLWVRPNVTGSAERPPLDVFDSQGRYLGRVYLPFKIGYSVPLIQNGQIYAITSDSMDVPYVVRARIEKR